MEKTFIMVKPDGVQRQLIGDILSRFERKGLQLAGAKLMRVTEQMAEKHYAEHQGSLSSESSLSLLLQGLYSQWFGKAKMSLK